MAFYRTLQIFSYKKCNFVLIAVVIAVVVRWYAATIISSLYYIY